MGADITGKQERIVRSKSKPSLKRSVRQSSEIVFVDYVLNLAIAQPKTDDAAMKFVCSIVGVLKIDIPSVV